MPNSETLLQFPCEFTIKVFGNASEDFENVIYNIIHQHVASLSKDSLHTRFSENGKYAALSVALWATSKSQLDAIYQDLSSSPIVLMAL